MNPMQDSRRNYHRPVDVSDEDSGVRVRPDDLRHLDVLHAILEKLADTHVSARELARHAAAFPPLRARITQLFLLRFPNATMPSLAEQIARFGNHTFESILLELLEDLTVLRSELEAER